MRVIDVVAACFPELSRSEIKRLIRAGAVDIWCDRGHPLKQYPDHRFLRCECDG